MWLLSHRGPGSCSPTGQRPHVHHALCRPRPARVCSMPGLPSPGLAERGEGRNIYSTLWTELSLYAALPLLLAASVLLCMIMLIGMGKGVSPSRRPHTRQGKPRLLTALVLCPGRRLGGPPQASRRS